MAQKSQIGGSRDGAVMRALASHQYVSDDSRTWCHICHMWVEFVVGSLSLLREVLLWVLQFSPLLKKPHTLKLQFDLEGHGVTRLCAKYIDI